MLYLKSMQKYTLILFMFGLWAVMPTQAQDKPGNGIWTLQQCINYAIQHNVSVKQSDLQVLSNQNTLLQSKTARYPSVGASASQNFSFGRNINPVTNSFVQQSIASNRFNINANLMLYNGGQISKNITQNNTNLEISQLNAQQSKNDISLNVALSYLDVLLGQELLEVNQQNVLSTQEQLDRTRKLFEAGAIAENDVIDLEATLANNQLQVTTTENQLMNSKLLLQQYMNLPEDENFQIAKVPVESLKIEEFAETSRQIYSTAESTQPNVKSADLNIQANELAIDIAHAGRLPSLTLDVGMTSNYSSAASLFDLVPTDETESIGFVSGTGAEVVRPSFNQIEKSYPFFNQLDDNLGQYISFSLNIPIFNRNQVKTQIQNAKINKRVAELQAKDVRNQLRQTIEQSYTNARAALNTYHAREKQLIALERTFETTQKRYEAGAANVVDFNLAKINRDNARSDLVRAKYDYLFRKKVLDFYQNKPLSFD